MDYINLQLWQSENVDLWIWWCSWAKSLDLHILRWSDDWKQIISSSDTNSSRVSDMRLSVFRDLQLVHLGLASKGWGAKLLFLGNQSAWVAELLKNSYRHFKAHFRRNPRKKLNHLVITQRPLFWCYVWGRSEILLRLS